MKVRMKNQQHFLQILGKYSKTITLFLPLIAGKGWYMFRVYQSLHNSNLSSFQASQREDLLNLNAFLKCTHFCAIESRVWNGLCLLEIKCRSHCHIYTIKYSVFVKFACDKLGVWAWTLNHAHWDLYDSWCDLTNLINYITPSIYINNESMHAKVFFRL